MKHNQMPDFTNVTQAAKKNVEVLTSAAQTATEGGYALFRRGAEIMQNNLTSSFEAVQNITSSTNPEQATAKQQEFAKNMIEGAVANTKEMIDLASKSTMDVFSSFGSKFTEHMSESMNAMSCNFTKK